MVFAHAANSNLFALPDTSGLKIVVNDTQFVVVFTIAAIAAVGVAAAAPVDTTAPVAAVSSSDADSVPVANDRIDVAPVDVSVNRNALDTLSNVTVNPGVVNPAWINVAAALNDAAPDSVIVADVFCTPSTVTIKVPDNACSWVSVIAAKLPLSNHADDAMAG